VAEVLRLPSLDVERRVLPDRVRRQAGLDRGEIDERLERRARLASGRHRAVVLALGVIAAADHGAHRAVRRHRHQRALADIELDAFRRQLVDHGSFRDRLQSRVDRGLDPMFRLDLADQVVQHLADPVPPRNDVAGAGGFTE